LANKIQFPVGLQLGVKDVCALVLTKGIKNKKQNQMVERQIGVVMEC